MATIYLRGLKKAPSAEDREEYPFLVPVIRNMTTLEFHKPVTILCGDNGCGKTTLMELLAAKLSAIRISEVFHPIEKARLFEQAEDGFTLWTGVRAKRNFYFSAEEFIQYIKWIEREKADARAAITEIRQEYRNSGRSKYAEMLAVGPHADTLAALTGMYGESLAKQSHGQGYLDFFSNRLIPGGLYLLDEPESALSYENQYVLSLMILRAVEQGCQFVLATHSPVMTAIPDAEILEIRDGEITQSSYDDLDNIRFFEFVSGTEEADVPSVVVEG